MTKALCMKPLFIEICRESDFERFRVRAINIIKAISAERDVLCCSDKSKGV